MANAPQRTHGPGIRVPGWQDALGAWVERRPRLRRRLGNWETIALQDRLGEGAIDRPTCICGWARSGTTILLTLLAEHPETTTHRYRDFPALSTPWAWNWFVDRAARGNEQPSERAHGDGLMVTADSPEAFDEVLWAAFSPPGKETVGPQCRLALARQTGTRRMGTVLGSDSRSPQRSARHGCRRTQRQPGGPLRGLLCKPRAGIVGNPDPLRAH